MLVLSNSFWGTKVISLSVSNSIADFTVIGGSSPTPLELNR